MPDTHQIRAHRNDIARADRDVRAALDNMHRHLTAIQMWLDTPDEALPGIHNLGTDSAELITAATRLKTLHDMSYLAN